MSAPKLRFKADDGSEFPEWVKQSLDRCCKTFTDGDWIESNDQSNTGIRLIQTGNIGTTEFLNKPDNRKWISEATFKRLNCKEVFPGDILVSRLPAPAGRACIVPDLGVKMITAVDCTIIRTEAECNKEFLVQYLSTPQYFYDISKALAGGTRQRISRSNLAEIIIPYPCLAEQQKIAACLSTLDNVIEQTQSEIAAWEMQKRGVMQLLFNRKVRFKADDGSEFPEWEENNIGAYLSVRDEKQVPTEEAPLKAFIAYKGVADKGDRYDRSFLVKSADKKYKRTELNDFIYSSNNLDVGSIGLNSYGTAVISDVYEVFKPKENVNPTVLDAAVQRKAVINAILRFRQGCLYGQYKIYPENFLSVKISLPSLAEQQKIAACLSTFDDVIDKTKKELDAYRELKKGLLQQMFV